MLSVKKDAACVKAPLLQGQPVACCKLLGQRYLQGTFSTQAASEASPSTMSEEERPTLACFKDTCEYPMKGNKIRMWSTSH